MSAGEPILGRGLRGEAISADRYVRMREALRALVEYAQDCAAELDERPPCIAEARAALEAAEGAS